MPISIKSDSSRASTPNSQRAASEEAMGSPPSTDLLIGTKRESSVRKRSSTSHLSEGLERVTISRSPSRESLSSAASGHLSQAAFDGSKLASLPTETSNFSDVQKNISPESPALSVGPASDIASPEVVLQRSSHLLDNGQATQAMQLLASLREAHPEVDGQYTFHSRYAQAALGHIDALNAQNLLGRFSIKAASVRGEVEISNFSSERLDCYLSVCKSNVRVLDLLNSPEQRDEFIKKNGAEILEVCIDGIRHGLGHAVLETRTLINRFCQCNSNVAMAAFLDRQVARGLLKEEDALVKSFREVQADPLYSSFVAAGHEVNTLVEASGQGNHTIVWQKWADEEKSLLRMHPDVVAALNYAPTELHEILGIIA